jgi:3-carboxy-cis,cis-muconate cycloisomerase
MAESLATALGAELGRARAQELVGEAARRAGAEEVSLADAATAATEIRETLGEDGIAAALDPAAYLGSTEAIIDRALAAHRARTGGTA